MGIYKAYSTITLTLNTCLALKHQDANSHFLLLPRQAKIKIAGILIISLSQLVACTNMQPHKKVASETSILSLVNYNIFGNKPSIPTEEDIFHLSKSQKNNFLNYYHNNFTKEVPAHERVADYLEHITENFSYHGKTYAASQAMLLSKGNCLSLAILTTALAKLVNIETGYHLVDATPIYELNGGVALKGRHVRTYLYDPTYQKTGDDLVLRRPGIIIDYFPSGDERYISNVSESEYIAMYYSNLSADALLRKDYSTSFWLLHKATEYAPNNSNVINLMAVLHKKVGDNSTSEQLFKYGILHSDEKLSLLKNYRELLYKQNRISEANKINAEIRKLDDPSPFNWLGLAQDSYNNKKYQEAIYFFDKSIEVAPYLHQSYIGKARSYYQLGDKRAAVKAIHQALEYTYDDRSKSLYHAKLRMLTKSQQQ